MSDITSQTLAELVKNIRDQILKNSPEKNEDFFVVPRVVD